VFAFILLENLDLLVSYPIQTIRFFFQYSTPNQIVFRMRKPHLVIFLEISRLEVSIKHSPIKVKLFSTQNDMIFDYPHHIHSYLVYIILELSLSFVVFYQELDIFTFRFSGYVVSFLSRNCLVLRDNSKGVQRLISKFSQ
jgi:hypothetical protein